MTLTDAMIGAAALWLLFVVCGMRGQRRETAAGVGENAPFLAVSPAAGLACIPDSVRPQDAPHHRHVTPPLPAAETDERGNTYRALGSVAVHANGLPQALSLTEFAIAPGGSLALADLGGSGLIVVQIGLLELAERDGEAQPSRSPLTASPAPREDEGVPTIAPGDRIAFGPGATIVLRNRSVHHARVLTASVMPMPGMAA